MSRVAWYRWYNTGKWYKRRRFQLQSEPWCKFCADRGIAQAATVVDHVVPHKGNWTAFMTGKLQSLCERCHTLHKRKLELSGYDSTIGTDGFPLDPNHPANRVQSWWSQHHSE